MFKSFILLSTLLLFNKVASASYQGIDVSVWQGSDINFSKVKSAGKNFVIMRAGCGTDKDKYFETNYSKAKNAGMNVGVYWYAHAKTEKAAKNEANLLLNALKGKKLEYPVYYDIENNDIFNTGKTSAIAEAFCSVMESNKYFCGIYSSTYMLNTYFSAAVRKKYTVWVAQYNTECTYKGAYKIWQRSSKGSVSGISGNVDLDISYEDFPSIVKSKHLNGY